MIRTIGSRAILRFPRNGKNQCQAQDHAWDLIEGFSCIVRDSTHFHFPCLQDDVTDRLIIAQEEYCETDHDPSRSSPEGRVKVP